MTYVNLADALEAVSALPSEAEGPGADSVLLQDVVAAIKALPRVAIEEAGS